ncbi:uncharacterized protein LOC116417554 [Nasonia vitripennis]|uniref:Uncharacterized protein n=1 Tax=Nasonia vitripennis TaxID=7425 RepID=A0A7M7TAF6_NASVI|nr:uncharacterized protein LOC116417554 [Nasonia vitripennis]
MCTNSSRTTITNAGGKLTRPSFSAEAYCVIACGHDEILHCNFKYLNFAGFRRIYFCAMPPNCWKPPKFDFWGFFKWGIFTKRRLSINYECIPLIAVNCLAIAALPFVIWSRTFVTTIDVTFGGLPRWEIPSQPTFFDLRHPRNLKWMKTDDWKPAIHLDNRYRLMRGEPMLDANGNETDEIGEDETAGQVAETR